jgi:hydrogenase maturation factor
MKLVTTTSGTYLCVDTEPGQDGMTVLKEAFEVDPQKSADVIAMSYIEARVQELLDTVTLMNVNIEKVKDATRIGPVVRMLTEFLPDAEKQARATAVLTALKNIVKDGTRKLKSVRAGSGVEDDEEEEAEVEVRPSRSAGMRFRG